MIDLTRVVAQLAARDDSSEPLPSDPDWSLYQTNPSKVLPVVFAVITAILGSIQLYQSFFRYQGVRKYGGIMVWASIVWVAGFATREYSVYHVQNVGAFIAQFVLILIGPPGFAAAEYFILGRLLCYVPYHAPLHPRRVVSTFFTLGVIVESLTGSGAGNSAGAGQTDDQRKVGYAIIKASLVLQALVEFLFFTIVAIVHHRCRKANTLPKNVRTTAYVLYTTSLLILGRCIFRAVDAWMGVNCDYSTGKNCGPANEHEWMLWVFEVMLIVIFIIILTIWHPGRLLPADHRQYLDPRDGKTERLGPGIIDQRPWWAGFADPFNIRGILSLEKRHTIEPFWQHDHPVAEKWSSGYSTPREERDDRKLSSGRGFSPV